MGMYKRLGTVFFIIFLKFSDNGKFSFLRIQQSSTLNYDATLQNH